MHLAPLLLSAQGGHFRPGIRRLPATVQAGACHLRGTRSASSCAEPEASPAVRRGGLGLFDARRAPIVRARSRSARPTRRLHVSEDGFLRARGHDGSREPGNMDVGSTSVPPPLFDRQHRDDVVRSYEPPEAERHHTDVSSSHNVFFHAHIVANACSGEMPGCDRSAGVYMALAPSPSARPPRQDSNLCPRRRTVLAQTRRRLAIQA